MILWRLQWSNPYTSPPEGMPRILAEELTARGAEPLNLLRMTGLGGGYALHWIGDATPKPIRRLSEESKQSIRRKSLERRARNQSPLFADEMIAQALASKPDYYGKP
jgi:hypothetical protein